VTITLYGDLDEVEQVRRMLDDLEALTVDRAEGPMTVKDGSGRWRMFLAVTL
jgi:hypothetical protein